MIVGAIGAIEVVGASITGQRPYQEDACEWIVLSDDPPHAFAVLADGMGGAVGGEVAGRLAVTAGLAAYRTTAAGTGDRLRAALSAANRAIAQKIDEDPAMTGMGCTFVALAVDQEGIHWISVGDSPLWLVRDGRLHRMNADHSMRPTLAKLVEAGHMTESEAARDPRRNALRSAVLGESEIELIDGPAPPVPVRAGDSVLVASDGIDTLAEAEIAAIAAEPGGQPAASTVAALLAAVEEKGKENQDNTTAVLVRIGADRKEREIGPT